MRADEGGGSAETTDTAVAAAPLDNFEIIPAISIQKGKIVQAKGTKYLPLKFRNVKPDTLDLIDILYETFEILLIIDLDGIYKNKPAVDLYKKISQLGDFWIDGGVRFSDTVIDLLITGAQNAVLSTKTMNDLDQLREAFELSENIIFGLDYNNHILSPDEQLRVKRPVDVIYEVKEMGVPTCLFADLGRVDNQQPMNVNLINDLLQSDMNLYIGGGIKNKELGILSTMEVTGAIVELKDVLNNPGIFALDPQLLDEIAPSNENNRKNGN